jgi:hypothetical protein
MNSSITLYNPTHLVWLIEPNCTCKMANNVCIRPQIFGAPVICVHRNVGTNFHYYLEMEPADNSYLLWLIFLAVFFVLTMQVFWAYLLNVSNFIILDCQYGMELEEASCQ